MSPFDVKALYIFDFDHAYSKSRKLNVISVVLALTDPGSDPTLPLSLGSSASVCCVPPSQLCPDLSPIETPPSTKANLQRKREGVS